MAGEGPTAADFGLGIDRLSIDPGEKGPTVHIHSLNFTISSREPRAETKSPDEAKQSHDNFAQIRTDIDIPVGEKVVVGRDCLCFRRQRACPGSYGQGYGLTSD